MVGLAFGGSALAGHIDDVRSYTGCLSNNDGNIVKVKEGDAPKSPCSNGQSQVHLSGGDITRLTVTAPLTGGGSAGAVTIGLDSKFTLPTCTTTGQVPKWNAANQAWTCGTDNDTTYTAGTGLSLSGTQFSIDSAYRVKNDPDCPTGQFVTGFAADGTPQCGAPPAAVRVFAASTAAGIPSTNLSVLMLSLNVPAGSYSVSATAALSNSDDEFDAYCDVTGGGSFASGATVSTERLPYQGTIALGTTMTFASAGTIQLSCSTNTDGVDTNRFWIQAITIS